ncbi:hypothetical protein SRB5_68960 [Streptomyces sp. RB5]|uniref:DUF1707 domain-containing protein n=1 Tax=Streptomyces smaragdinus TaxID=2585196 RepID=A0A7K0CVK1_9ACTN|nr:DUF1707 domain-containing protein [Streptomyces smaragdinus]MQY16694.1 hypothetical protein [Streptomyces smaragdinus]
MAATPPERSGIRVSNADRDAVIDQLRDAAAEGRIELDELEERVELALKARTFADLAPLTADLPVSLPVQSAPPLTLKGGMHGARRVGAWEVPERIEAHGGMGGVRIDFTRTEVRLPEVTVEAYGEMAGVTVVVPDGWAVDTTGFDPGTGGLKDRTTPDRAPGTPLIRLTGAGGMAGVAIRHPGRWERRKLRTNPAK